MSKEKKIPVEITKKAAEKIKELTKKKFSTPAAMKLNIIVVITMWLPLFACR